MTSPKVGQHEFAEFSANRFERQKMPDRSESERKMNHLNRLESDGLLGICSSNTVITPDGWREARKVVQHGGNLPQSVLIVPSAGALHETFFAETWRQLPARLAALSLMPPAGCAILCSTTEPKVQRVLQVAQTAATSFDMWRCLIELSKSGARIELLVEKTGAEFVEFQSNIAKADSSRHWLPELLSSPPRHELDWLFGEIKLARLADLCGEVASPEDATAVLAGLWLLHGHAEQSHQSSQSIEDEGRQRSGNFWHAIMHRQEPDYFNSKYWFRRVGRHPVFSELARLASRLIEADGSGKAQEWAQKLGLPDRFDPFVFVDWCESAARQADSEEAFLVRQIQFVEMHLLLRASYRDAASLNR